MTLLSHAQDAPSFDAQAAQQAVELFVRAHDESYRRLAYYAAIPLLLTPELLNYLRNRFLRGQVHWVAEVDLLLSDLCRPVDGELYAMPAPIRAHLLAELRANLGDQVLQEVARTLIHYVRHLARTNPFLAASELQAQQWAAMVYLDDQRAHAAREIAQSFQSVAAHIEHTGLLAAGPAPRAELARLTRLTQTLAPELQQYPELVKHAALISQILADDPTQQPRLWPNYSASVEGIELRLPTTVARPNLGTGLSYLDFFTEVTPANDNNYHINVRSPAGEASATLIWPFDELALENRLKDVQIALLSAGGGRRTLLTPAEQAVQRFGAELFDLLFAGEVRNRYDVSQLEAHHQGKGLRVKLRIQPPALAVLPWEFLHDPRRGEYICLSQQTPLVRYLELPQTIRPLAVTPPLRILAMIASPTDVPALDVQVERQRLDRALLPLQAAGLVELHWLPGQSWRDLQRALRREQWHIFHFTGHGDFDTLRDEGLIVLANAAGRAERFSAGDLGRLLADHRSLRLAVLNACLGAQGSTRDLFASTAATLVRRGLPAVVAMQYAITDAAAIEFTQTFYESLADGLPVDAAMSQARKAISFAIPNTLEWGAAVLYTRSPDGQLFDLIQTQGRSVSTPYADNAYALIIISEQIAYPDLVKTAASHHFAQVRIQPAQQESFVAVESFTLNSWEQQLDQVLNYLSNWTRHCTRLHVVCATPWLWAFALGTRLGNMRDLVIYRFEQGQILSIWTGIPDVRAQLQMPGFNLRNGTLVERIKGEQIDKVALVVAMGRDNSTTMIDSIQKDIPGTPIWSYKNERLQDSATPEIWLQSAAELVYAIDQVGKHGEQTVYLLGAVPAVLALVAGSAVSNSRSLHLFQYFGQTQSYRKLLELPQKKGIYSEEVSATQPPHQHLTDLFPGQKLSGRIVSLVNFGAFVDVGVGIDGLVHISRLRKEFVNRPWDVVRVGDMVTVWVENVDLERKRISLTMIDPYDHEAATTIQSEKSVANSLHSSTSTLAPVRLTSNEEVQPGISVTGKVTRIEANRVLIDIGSTELASLAFAQIDGQPTDPDEVANRFPVGTEIEARVLRVNRKGRVQLTLRSPQPQPRQSLEHHKANLDSTTFKELGDLLSPLMADQNNWRSLLHLAVGNSPVYRQIQFDGAANTFSAQMVSTLWQFGEIAPGQPALVSLLEVVRSQVSLNQQRKLDDLISKLKGLSGYSIAVPEFTPYYDKSWAVVIGISDYGRRHPKLASAINDAQAMAGMLQQHGFESIHTLYDSQATRHAIMAWLRNELPNRTAPNDRVVFFFAGHGVTQPDRNGRKRGYLVPYDANNFADYIDMEELRHACAVIPAKHILVLLDCCFSGVAAVTVDSTLSDSELRTGTVKPALSDPAPSIDTVHPDLFDSTPHIETARSTPAPSMLSSSAPNLDDAYLARITSRRAWQILTASNSDEQISDSSTQPNHSAFTSALLVGLAGEADHDGDGLITATDLASYVRPRVVRDSATLRGRSQIPFFNYLLGSDLGDFVFTIHDRRTI